MQNEKTQPRGIFVVVIALLASYAIAINFSKVSACSELIIRHFDVGAAELGNLISLIGIVGIFLSLPAGIACSKFGPRVCGIFMLLFSLAGSILGSFAPSFEVLLFSRVLDGIGIGTVAAIIPSVIAE